MISTKHAPVLTIRNIDVSCSTISFWGGKYCCGKKSCFERGSEIFGWIHPPALRSSPPRSNGTHMSKRSNVSSSVFLWWYVFLLFFKLHLYDSLWQMEKDVKKDERKGWTNLLYPLQQKQSWLYFSNCTLILFLTLTGVRGKKRLPFHPSSPAITTEWILWWRPLSFRLREATDFDDNISHFVGNCIWRFVLRHEAIDHKRG